MPSASTSTFIMPSASMSSLSHSMKVRSSIAALPIGTDLVEPSARQDEAADMLREVAREADELRRRAPAARRISGSAGSSPACRICAIDPCACPSCPRPCWPVAAVTSSVRPSALPTSRMALRGTIADDGGGKPGALAAIALIDVLDHLLAPLMLEIDVDVGRLAPLFRDEALEQQIDLGRDRRR